MRKIYTTLGVVLLSTLTLMAQKQIGSVDRVDFDLVDLGSRTPTDTIWPNEFANGTPTLYGSTNGGYVVGNNGYGDLAKGQVFLTSGTVVEEAIFLFGGKDDGGNGSNIIAELRAFDGTGTTTVGSGEPAPGTLLSSVNVALADVDTSGGFTVAQFPSPEYVGTDFYLGFDVSGLAAGDTVGLVTTQDGEANMAELNWEKWSDNAWHSMLEAWGIDFDFGIWAVVDNNSAGIEDGNYFNGIKADCYPNPAVNNANIVFELESAAKVNVEVYSLTGQQVFAAERGQLTQGRHTVVVPVNNLDAGTYYYSINANGNRLTKKLIVK